MGKKKGVTGIEKPAAYRVQFFDKDWTECEFLRREGPMPKMLLEVAMWVRSREQDQTENDMIVFSIYYNCPFITIEEITDGKATKWPPPGSEWSPADKCESASSADIDGSH